MKKIGTTVIAFVLAMLPYVQGHATRLNEVALVIDDSQTVVKDGEKVEHFHREVFYDIRRSDNDPSDPVMKEVAEFMNRHPEVIITIVGYADKGTGNYTLNQMYANLRAQRFRNDLISRYGIDGRRISTDSKGDTVQPFSRNDMNRCVLIDAYVAEKEMAKKKEEKPIVIHNATIISDELREQHRQDKQKRYDMEMQRHRRGRPRTDTIYVSRTDTLWIANEPDTLKPERAFGLNKANRMRNWFITFEGGPGVFQGDHNLDAEWKDRVYPAFNASIGKWILPALGFRAAVDLDMIHSYYNANAGNPNPLADYYGEFVHGASPTEPYSKRPWLYRMRYNAWNFHGDLLVNFSSLMWRPYNRRIWNLIGYVGLGCIATWDHGSPEWHNQDWFNYGMCWNLGVINSFRISERFDINLDIRVKKFPDDFNCFRQGHSREGITNVMIGGTWHFTKRGF